MSAHRGPLVPMPRRVSVADEGEIALEMPRAGHRVSMVVAEQALDRFPREAIAHAVERLALEVVHREGPAITNAVHSFILDREWAEPIIREEIRRAVSLIIADMLLNSEMGDMLQSQRTPDSPGRAVPTEEP